MAFGEHRNECNRGRNRRQTSGIDGIDVAMRDEVRQVQVRKVALSGAVDRMVLRSDQYPKFGRNLRIARELPELRGRTPGVDVEEHEIHVAAREDRILG